MKVSTYFDYKFRDGTECGVRACGTRVNDPDHGIYIDDLKIELNGDFTLQDFNAIVLPEMPQIEDKAADILIDDYD